MSSSIAASASGAVMCGLWLAWHGAAPDSPAVQFSVYGGTLEWKEAVTVEEYTGRRAR